MVLLGGGAGMTSIEQEETRQRAVRQFSEALVNLLEAFTPLASPPVQEEPKATPTKAAAVLNGPIEVWPYLNTKTLAELLGVGAQTVRKWRLTGGGPPYMRIGGTTGGRVLYKRDEVDTWLAQRRFPHTAAETARRWELERGPTKRKPR